LPAAYLAARSLPGSAGSGPAGIGGGIVALTYPEAIVVGLVQGVTELFPVSSLGHSVLLPALVGGRWAADLSVSAPESPYLAFIVGLHVATALALVIFFRSDWVRIVRGLLTSMRDRRVSTPDQRSSRCCRGSAGPGCRWSPAWSAGSPTRTRPGSPSCSRRR
jgi:Bacitracin resistance protein BacA